MAEKQVVRCASCGANNRVDLEKIAEDNAAVCARCKKPLTLSSKPVTVTDVTFASEVESSAVPVLLDLWAPWCGPCRMIAPVLEQLAAEMAGRVRIAKLNVDENQATAARFNVRSIPTLLILKSGREVDALSVSSPSRRSSVDWSKLLRLTAEAKQQDQEADSTLNGEPSAI